jgi:hypothetical protein
VDFVAEIQDTSGAPDGGLGNSGNFQDYVEARPSTPLVPENWYEFRLSTVPSRVRLAPEHLRNLSGGGVAVRFTTGSHPTVQSITGCLKDDFRVEIGFSEAINVTSDMPALLKLEPTRPSGVCTLAMPTLPVTTVGGFRFECLLDVNEIGQVALFAAQSITAPTGAGFEASPGVPGDYSLLVEDSMWQKSDSVCGRVTLP